MDPAFKLASFLAHPKIYEREPEMIHNSEIHKVLSILRQNKVLMRALTHLDAKETREGPSVRIFLEDEEFQRCLSQMRKMEEEYLEILRLFNEKNIQFVLIKASNCLPLDSDNFDILVQKADLLRLIDLLTHMGFVEVIKAREPFKILLRCVKGGKDYLALHLHTRIGWEGIEFLSCNDVWKKYRRLTIQDVEVGFPAPEHHVLITLAHAFFENQCLKLSDILYLADSLMNGSGKIDWGCMRSWVKINRWTIPFFSMLEISNHIYNEIYGEELTPDHVWKEYMLEKKKLLNMFEMVVKALKVNIDYRNPLPLQIPLIIPVVFFMRKMLTEPGFSINRRFMSVAYETCEFLIRRFGLKGEGFPSLLVFTGADGTGKTTHAKTLIGELTRRGIKAKYLWSRPPPFFFELMISQFMCAFLGAKHFVKADKDYFEKRERLLSREPFRTIWSAFLLFSHILQLILELHPKLAFSNGVIVCDRYIYDTVIDIDSELERNFANGTVGRVITSAVPRPNVIFVMTGDSNEIARRRSNERNGSNSLAKKIGKYSDFCRRTKEAIMLDTTKELENNKREILEKALYRYYSGSTECSDH